MDLLGSIMNSMDKPPGTSDKEKERIKKQKELVDKHRDSEKRELLRFRKFCEERIERFLKDANRKSIEFQPLSKVYRSVILDVVEVAGLIGMSFGQDDIDRYTIVYKKDFAPTEDEVHARRSGEKWNAEKAKEYAQKRVDAKLIEADRSTKSDVVVPATNYKDKYVHLIGQEAALEAAKKTESNKSYGFVPSANKKDVRTIEDVQADIQAKKRLKIAHTSTAAEPPMMPLTTTTAPSSDVACAE